MTPAKFANEIWSGRLERADDPDTTLKDMFLRRHPELSEAEYNNLVTIAHQKGLI
jgi:hypothetical protein